MGLNRTSESKVMTVQICEGLCCSILSISLYYGPQSNNWVKSYGGWTLSWASLFNFSCLDILWDSIRHSSQMLWAFELARGFFFNFVHFDILLDLVELMYKKLSLFEFSLGFLVQFRASRYIMSLNQTSESKVMVTWIGEGICILILSVSMHYEPQSDICVKIYGHLNLPKASFFNFKRLNILWFSIGHLSQKIWQFEFARSFLIYF